jgi:hypothetical protein
VEQVEEEEEEEEEEEVLPEEEEVVGERLEEGDPSVTVADVVGREEGLEEPGVVDSQEEVVVGSQEVDAAVVDGEASAVEDVAKSLSGHHLWAHGARRLSPLLTRVRYADTREFSFDTMGRWEFIGDMMGMGSTLACKESNVVRILRSLF